MSTETTPDASIPSAARLSRIESVLTGEPAFKGKIGKKTVTVPKRDGSKVHFAPEVVDVGRAIQADNKDAVTLSKKEILGYAIKVLNGGAAPASEAADTGDEPAPGPSAPAGEVAPAAGKSLSDLQPQLNQNISILSLLVSAMQIADLDKQAGADGRRKKLKELAEEYAPTCS
jgi:hypothetical protein